MSRMPVQTFPGYAAQPTNGLGLAGFICSLVGLVLTGGLLCPVGLILSLVALGRQPRGFAIAGVIIGLLGTCGGLLIIFAFGAIILAALGLSAAAVFIAMNDPQRTELTVEMANIAQAVEQNRDPKGILPASLTSLGLAPGDLTDPWNNPYTYTFINEKPGYDIISHGQDGQSGTADDVQLSKLDELWDGYLKFNPDKSGGGMSFELGDKKVILKGDEDGGRVTIESGGKTVNLTGGEDGGHITVTETPATPMPPQSPEPPTSAPSAPPG